MIDPIGYDLWRSPYMNDRTSKVYAEIKTELSRLIKQNVVYDEIKQDNDVISCIGAVCIEMKLNCYYQSDKVQSMKKTRQDKDVIDHTRPITSKLELN